jgi:hypothetical protein
MSFALEEMPSARGSNPGNQNSRVPFRSIRATLPVSPQYPMNVVMQDLALLFRSTGEIVFQSAIGMRRDFGA